MTLFLDRLLKLCIKNDVAPSSVAEKCGLTRQAYSHWKKRDSIPNAAALKKIADYFGVTADYFVDERYEEPETYNDPPVETLSDRYAAIDSQITEHEYFIINQIRNLPDDARKRLEAYVDGFCAAFGKSNL